MIIYFRSVLKRNYVCSNNYHESLNLRAQSIYFVVTKFFWVYKKFVSYTNFIYFGTYVHCSCTVIVCFLCSTCNSFTCISVFVATVHASSYYAFGSKCPFKCPQSSDLLQNDTVWEFQIRNTFVLIEFSQNLVSKYSCFVCWQIIKAACSLTRESRELVMISSTITWKKS